VQSSGSIECGLGAAQFVGKRLQQACPHSERRIHRWKMLMHRLDGRLGGVAEMVVITVSVREPAAGRRSPR
jgi:hypothetical protein